MVFFCINSEKPLNFPGFIKVLSAETLLDSCGSDEELQELFEAGYTLQDLENDTQYQVKCKDKQRLMDFCRQTPGIYDFWEV